MSLLCTSRVSSDVMQSVHSLLMALMYDSPEKYGDPIIVCEEIYFTKHTSWCPGVLRHAPKANCPIVATRSNAQIIGRPSRRPGTTAMSLQDNQFFPTRYLPHLNNSRSTRGCQQVPIRRPGNGIDPTRLILVDGLQGMSIFVGERVPELYRAIIAGRGEHMTSR